MANPSVMPEFIGDPRCREESLQPNGKADPLVSTRQAPSTSSSSDTLQAAGNALAPLSKSTRIWFTIGPVVVFVLILFVTAALSRPSAAGFLVSIALGTFVGGGKLMILAGAVEGAPLGPWALAALIVYVDLGTALIALGGMHHIFRLPALGSVLRAAQESGWRILQHNPWMHRVTWISVALFIAVPFQATGAFVGVVIGRLLGLSRGSIVTATAFGSFLGSTALALAGDYWQGRITAFAHHPIVALALVIGIVSTSMAVSYLVSKRR